MERRFLHRSELDRFLALLRGFGELHGPVLSPLGVPSFALLEDPALLRLDFTATQIPPKKYLLPFRETILHYGDGGYRQPEPAPPGIVLFGVHPCDLKGIAYLDLVFLGERPDPGYAARRAALTLIGLSCAPDDFCFCKTPFDSRGCDLFLEAVSDGFLLAPASYRGEAIAHAARELLAPAPETAGGEDAAEVAAPFPFPAQDPALRFSAHPKWERFAATCVSCGACSVCCPTCYCFDVREYPALSGGGERVREWDNCLFATHGEVAGSNFRPARLDRLRYRFLHKYCGFSPLEGISSCVGCGRCKRACPVAIDLRELVELP